MALLTVDLTDFEDRPYRIPNQTESKDLAAFLETKEGEVLLELLGYNLKKAFLAGLAADPVLSKWTDLKNGAEYTYGDRTCKYAGLNGLMVPRLYALWLSETRDKFTDIGTVFNTSEQNERVSPSRRIVEAYNIYARLVGDYYNQANTLYGFLVANDGTYTEWDVTQDFTNPGRLNEFGL